MRPLALAACILALCNMVVAAEDDPTAQTANPAAGTSVRSTVEPEALQGMIEAAVAQKLRPLQREIVELREEIRLHDILGGIGYIVGIAGISFYFLGVRRRDRTGDGGGKA